MCLIKMMILLAFLSSCATRSDNQLVKDSRSLEFKTIDGKKALVKKMVGDHNELNQVEKDSIRKVLLDSLDAIEVLRKRESQLIQQILNYTLVQQGDYNDLVALKLELKNVYQEKYKNFEDAILKLKKTLSIKPKNKILLDDPRMQFMFEHD